MKIPFREARLKPFIVGILKYSALITKLMPIAAGATGNARYCYAVWMRHLTYLSKYNGGKVPVNVAELGPGDSIGVGLAALLSGAESYVALDVIKYWDNNRNIRILDELLVLFRKREEIPDNSEFPILQPVPENFDFPALVITNEILKTSLDPERIAKIRSELLNPGNEGNTFIRYKIPWHDKGIIEPGTVDFILSHTVLQHIDGIENTYTAMQAWLKPSGFMAHLIDFKSMGFTKKWNAHWTLSDWEWRMLVGGRKFSINREPHSKHIELHNQNCFNILFLKIEHKANELKRNQLAKRFSSLSDDDLSTSGSYIICQKV